MGSLPLAQLYYILMPSVIKTAHTSMLERSKSIYLHVSIYYVKGDMLSSLPSGFKISNIPSTGSSVILLSRPGVLSKVMTNMRTRNHPNGYTACACALDEAGIQLHVVTLSILLYGSTTLEFVLQLMLRQRSHLKRQHIEQMIETCKRLRSGILGCACIIITYFPRFFANFDYTILQTHN